MHNTPDRCWARLSTPSPLKLERPAQRAPLQVELKRNSSTGGLLEPMSKAAARRAATADAVARAVALLCVFALFAGSLHLTPQLSASTADLPTELSAQRLDLAHQPTRASLRGTAQLRHGTASLHQPQQERHQVQDGVLSFPVCGDFAEQRMALLSGAHQC